MSRIIPLGDVLDMDHKELVRATSGVLVKIWAAKSGMKQDGQTPWKLQNGTLKDPDTGIEVPLVLVDQAEDIPLNWRGQTLIFEAHQGDKGFSGLYAYDEEYPAGTITRKLRVTATGMFSIEGNGSAPPQRSAPPKKQPPQRQSGTPNQPPARTQPAPPRTQQQQRTSSDSELTKEQREDRAVKDAKKHLAKLANLYNLVVDCVDAVIVPHMSNMSDELYLNAISSLFIPSRDLFAMNMPVAPINGKPKDDEPVAQPEPEPAPEPAPAPEPGTPPPKAHVAPPPDYVGDDDEIPF